jgi:hypothetical protein
MTTDERHREIGAAVERACRELPDGFDLQLELEKDAGTVRLDVADTDASIDEFAGDTFADHINAAIRCRFRSPLKRISPWTMNA